MKNFQTAVTGAVITGLLLAAGPLPLLYVHLAGAHITGRVVNKREFFAMPGSDRWTHVFEVTYEYRPADSPYPLTASHAVDEALYRRLQSGAPVRVRYSPWAPLRHMKAIGSAVEDSTVWSRFSVESDTVRVALEVAAFVLTIALGFLAYRRKTKALTLAAVFSGAVVCSGILLMGFLVFPVLLCIWRKSPGKGYGAVLVAAMAASAVVIYWRIPKPPSMPGGPARTTTAKVAKVELVDHIWGDIEDAGQDIPQPFQMVDLELRPEGTAEPVHFIDHVDEDSVPGLKEGAAVEVVYSLTNPHTGRIVGGTRLYAGQALAYMLKMTYGIAAVILIVVLPFLLLVARVGSWFSGLRSRLSAENIDKAVENMSRMPLDDPRRKALEKLFKERPGG